MMKLLLIGATGRTGQHILQGALERGHLVHTIVRDASKVKKHDRLTLFEGFPSDPELINEAIKGCQAVLVALNVSRQSDWPWSALRSPKTLISNTISQLIQAMNDHQVNRIITISAWGTNETFKELPSWFRWLIRNSNIKYPYLDHERHEELLKNTDLNYTVLRPAGLTNGKKEKKVIVSFQKEPKPSFVISRKNVACFMLDCLEHEMHLKELPTISEK
jgi:putative NADH-flavin reductase